METIEIPMEEYLKLVRKIKCFEMFLSVLKSVARKTGTIPSKIILDSLMLVEE